MTLGVAAATGRIETKREPGNTTLRRPGKRKDRSSWSPAGAEEAKGVDSTFQSKLPTVENDSTD